MTWLRSILVGTLAKTWCSLTKQVPDLRFRSRLLVNNPGLDVVFDLDAAALYRVVHNRTSQI